MFTGLTSWISMILVYEFRVLGEEFWEEPNNTPILPPKVRAPPGRPKKNRDKRSDVIETRESDPTMLKRYQTSLNCTYCKEKGHNTRTCKAKVSTLSCFISHLSAFFLICLHFYILTDGG